MNRQPLLELVKTWLARTQTKQLLIMLVIAGAGLLSGSLIAVKGADSALVVDSPAPLPTVTRAVATPTVKPSPLVKASRTPAPAISKKPSSPVAKAKAKRTGFNWGITIQPFPFREKNELYLPEQFRLAKELGLNAVRVEYSPNNAGANKQAIGLAKQHNLQLIFMIPFGPNDIFTDQKLYDNAYHYVADIVGQYKGQVAVWQLATEPASVALIDGGHHGVDRVDYPEDKYQAVSTWLKAAAKAVKESDPGARRLINDQWVHVGFFDRFLAEGGDFDILGWNWFSDMGTDFNKVVLDHKTGQSYSLMKKLKSFNHDIWITELNRRGGSNDGNEKAQADYIQEMAERFYAEQSIKAVFVFLLAEDETAPPKERGYSLVNLDLAKQWTAGPKEAYGRYQSLIKAK